MTDAPAAARLAEIRARLDAAARGAGRDPREVELVAVSKTFGTHAIRPVLAAGHRVFGENRVQEAAAKWPELKAAFEGVELHLIGALQSNKAKEAVALFDAIHSLDRESLAAALAEAIARQGRRPKLFVQINTGEEPQKGGVPPREAAAFVARCRNVHGLEIFGLMCIPPADDEPSPHFALLAELARDCEVAGLSMGMSGDYETAARLGATHVRVGSAIFGERA